MIRRLIPLAVSVALALGLAGCSSADVTGEPEDVEEFVHVVADGSGCTRDGGSIVFHVRLDNTGRDERTVSITPRVRDSGGDTIGNALNGFELSIGGNDEADGDAVIEDAPDDADACFVQIDGGDDIRIDADLGDAG